MQADWLDTPEQAISALESEPDYLSLDPPAGAGDGIEAVRADAPYSQIKFEVMKGDGRDRVWACNGRYVACRPSGFHEGTRSRHQKFLRAGHYRHVGTFDDVQIFELKPQSPFYRTEGDVRAGSWYELMRAAAIAAVVQDWGAYVDLLSEIATRLKSSPTGTESGAVEPAIAKDRFMETLEHLEQLIFMRWRHDIAFKEDQDYGKAMSAMRAVIDSGVREIRARRGEKPGRLIALPARPMVIR